MSKLLQSRFLWAVCLIFIIIAISTYVFDSITPSTTNMNIDKKEQQSQRIKEIQTRITEIKGQQKTIRENIKLTKKKIQTIDDKIRHINDRIDKLKEKLLRSKQR
jgi:peptidoglycan hydrolase CwlO-like protein